MVHDIRSGSNWGFDNNMVTSISVLDNTLILKEGTTIGGTHSFHAVKKETRYVFQRWPEDMFFRDHLLLIHSPS